MAAVNVEYARAVKVDRSDRKCFGGVRFGDLLQMGQALLTLVIKRA